MIYAKFEDVARRHANSVVSQLVKSSHLSVLSYRDLKEHIEKVAAVLNQLGVKPGYRIALIANSSSQWIINFLAINSLRATVVALDPFLEKDQLIKQLVKADCFLAITTYELYQEISANVCDVIPALLINYDNYEVEQKLTVATRFKSYQDDGDAEIAAILFTSGTTGDYKGVELTNAAILHAVNVGISNVGVNAQDNIMCVLPAHHVYGLVYVILAPLVVGAKTTFVEKVQGDLILSAMKITQPTIFVGVPRIFELFTNKIFDAIDHKPKLIKHLLRALLKFSYLVRKKTKFNLGKKIFSSVQKIFGGKLRYFISGSAPLSIDLFKKLESLGFTTIEGYGLTETSACVTANTPKRRVQGSVGKPPAGIKVKLHFIEHDCEEICVSGESLMKGYFRDPEATNRVIKEGWFHTGDLGKFDSDGSLVISGRIKEMIVLPNGKKAMANVIEEQYKGIKEIAEIAVVGMPMPDGSGEKVCAAIKLTDALPVGLNTSQYKELVKTKISEKAKALPEWWAINHIYFVDEIPKTNTLKVKRNKLVEQLLKQHEKSNTDENFTIRLDAKLASYENRAKAVVETIIEVINVFQPQLEENILLAENTSFRTYLGLDSLSKFELLSALEKKLKIKISPEEFSVIDTPRELILLVEQARVSGNTFDNASLFDLKNNKEVNLLKLNNRVGILGKFLRWSYGIYFKLEVHGKNNLPNEPFILCANHTSHLDGVSLAFASGMQLSDFVVLAAKDYFFKTNLSKNIMRRVINMIPFDRTGTPEAIETNTAYIEYCRSLNKNIILFPEGTRSISGKLQDFKLGAALFADKLNIKIVPAYIHGAYELLPKGKKVPRKGRITVRFGKPYEVKLTPEVQDPLHRYKTYKESTDFLRSEIQQLRSSLEIVA